MRVHSDIVGTVIVDPNPSHVDGLENIIGNSSSGFSSDSTDMKIFDTEEKRYMPAKDPDQFPDGGLRAWSVVGASFLLVFCTFGKSRLCQPR